MRPVAPVSTTVMGYRGSGMASSTLGEPPQRVFGPAEEGLAVGHQQHVEVEIKHVPIRLAEPSFCALGILHVLLGNEPELRAVMDDAICAGERVMVGNMERGLVRADRVDLVRDHVARKLVAEVERLDRTASLQLVQAIADAVHGAPERLAELPGMAVVVPIGEEDMLWGPMLLKPAESGVGC